jgi:dipicolinate synthase subunit A
LEHAFAVILPLPVTLDGVRVHCPLGEVGEGLRLSTLLQAMRGKHLFGGRLSDELLEEAKRYGVSCTDYFQSEELQLRNALPTVEGAICIAMQELPVTLFDTCAAVIGYGRIGAMLAQRLRVLGMRVSVLARRQEALVQAELCGHRPVLLSERTFLNSNAIPDDCRVLFNTVPSLILTREVLQTLPPKCVLIDLASVPGGVDQRAAQELGLRSIWATALPGRHTPESAGEILGQTLAHLLTSLPPDSDK